MQREDDARPSVLVRKTRANGARVLDVDVLRAELPRAAQQLQAFVFGAVRSTRLPSAAGR